VGGDKAVKALLARGIDNPELLDRVKFEADPDIAKSMNPNMKTFADHQRILRAQVEVAWKYPGFVSAMKDGSHSLTREFFTFMTKTHDAIRYIMNGAYPLSYVDKVGGALVQKIWPNVPYEYYHKLESITGEKQAVYESVNLQERFVQILKTFDTLGKRRVDGRLMLVEDIASPDGLYQQWIDKQQELGRLPMRVVGHFNQERNMIQGRKVSPKEYADMDRSLTLAGVAALQCYTGVTYDDFSQEVEMLLADKRFI
jgi:hypothetical protein